MADANNLTVPSIRLVIADVDGALVTREKVLTTRAAEAVRKLRKAGIAFTITSGRPPLGLKMLIDMLNLTDPIAAFNGGTLIKPYFSVLRQYLLSASATRQAIRTMSDRGLDVWLYTDREWLVHDSQAPHVAREEWTVKFPPSVTPNFDPFLDHAVKIVGVSDDFDLVAQCEKSVSAVLGQQVTAARSQPYYLDVTHPKANKGEVVLMLAAELHIPVEQIATIGDMPSDVLMFRKSGVSIAMGNASLAVQGEAKFVTTSNEEEGFAKAMERFVLPQHRLLITRHLNHVVIAVDGGIHLTNAAAVIKAGADILVAGSQIFNTQSSVSENIQALFNVCTAIYR